MIGIKLDLSCVGGGRTAAQQAIDVIRRLGGTALFIPDEYGWSFGAEKITAVVDTGATLSGVDVVENTANSYHGLSFTNSTTLQAQFRFRAKAGTKSWVWARFEGYASGNGWFDLSTGTVGTVESGVVAKMTAAGDGYYDCTLTNRNIAAAGNCTLIAVTANTSTATYLGTSSVAFQLASYSVKEITSAAVFVDSTGVTPVTAVGDLVGKLNSQTSSNHATQPTTASKPVVTRVPERLGPELIASQDLTTWTSGGAFGNWAGSTATSTVLTSTGALGSRYVRVPCLPNKTYTFTATVTAGTANGAVAVSFGTSGNTFISEQTAAFVASGVSRTTLVSPANAAFVEFVVRGGASGQTTTFTALSAGEVLEWTNAISFDGSNDFLTTGITTGNEGWVCAGVTPATTPSPQHRYVANGATSSGSPGVMLAEDTTGLLVQLCDGVAIQTISDPYVPGTSTGPRTVDAGWNASTVVYARNGSEKSTARTRSPVSASSLWIGVSPSGVYHTNGAMTAIIYTPVLPSAADRDLIRKWVGSLQGQTL